MKYYFTRTQIYNEYRWYCLYIDHKGWYTSVVHVPTARIGTNIEITTSTKIKEWEI